MKKRIVSMLLLLVMALSLLPVQTRAASDAAELVSTGFSLTSVPYIKYRWHGRTYTSTGTSTLFNHSAWESMSWEDREAVVRHYAGCAVKMGQDFGRQGRLEMLDWFNTNISRWSEAAVKMKNKRLKEYPELTAFYRPTLPAKAETLPNVEDRDVVSAFTSQELHELDMMRDDYLMIYSTGHDYFETLIDMRRLRDTEGVGALMSEMYRLILSQATGGRPAGASMSELMVALTFTAEDARESTMDAWNTYGARQAAYEKLKGSGGIQVRQEEDNVITNTDDPAVVIAVFNKKIARLESYCNACMEACKVYEARMKVLADRIPGLSDARSSTRQQSEEERMTIARDAIDHGVAAIDLDPDVSSVIAIRESFKEHVRDDDYGNPVYEWTEKSERDYRAAEREEARRWATLRSSGDEEVFNGLVDSFEEEHKVGQVQVYLPWDNAMGYLFSVPAEGEVTYDVNFHGEHLFAEMGQIMGTDEEFAYYMVDDKGNFFFDRSLIRSGGLLSPEHLLWERSDYAACIAAMNTGFARVIDSMKAARATFKREFVDACEKRLKDMDELSADTMAVRTDWYSLEHAIYGGPNEDGGYGDWSVSTGLDYAERRLDDMAEEAARDWSDNLRQLQRMDDEIANVEAIYDDYKARADAVAQMLPDLYALLCETQDDIDVGLNMVRTGWEKLQMQQENYPDWLKKGDWANTSAAEPTLNSGLWWSTDVGRQYFSDNGDLKSENTRRSNANMLYNQIKGWAESEAEYIDRIRQGYDLYTAALEVRQAAGVDVRETWYNEETGTMSSTVNGTTYHLLDNLNAMYLGPLTLQSAWTMLTEQEFCGQEQDEDGNPIPLERGQAQDLAVPTDCLQLLENDLNGQGEALDLYRAYREEIMDIRGDLMRRAASAGVSQDEADSVRDWIQALRDNAVSTNPGGWYDAVEEQYHSTKGLYNTAVDRSLTPFCCVEYYNREIAPILDRAQSVLDATASYTPVTDITKNDAPQASRTPGKGSADVTLSPGGTKQLTARVLPDDATFPEITWASSDNSVALVDENGLVTAVALGAVTITATAQDSPSKAPIRLTYTVEVTAGEYGTMEEIYQAMTDAAEEWSAIGSVTAQDGSAVCSGMLVYNGEEFYAPQLLCALYDGDRLLAVSETACSIMNRSECGFSVSAPLPAGDSHDLKAKLFLAEQGAYQPAAGYTPLALNAPAGEPAAPAGDPDSGIYGVSDGAVITRIATAAGEAVTAGSTDGLEGFYPGGERFSVTCPDTVDGSAYTLYVVKGDGAPTAENLYYIGQKTADGASLTFDGVLPKVMQTGQYKVYVVGEGRALDTAAPLAAFSYHSMARWDLTVSLQSADADASVTLTRNGSTAPGAGGLNTQLLNGHYTLTVTRDGCVAFTRDFDLQSDMTLNVPPLVKWGNVNGATDNGIETSVTDMACLFTWLSANRNEGQIADEDYFRQVCDVNGDGAVDILDYQALYASLQAA